MKVTTTTGFQAKITKALGNDFRFVQMYRDFLSDDPVKKLQAMADMPEFVLGKDGAEALYQHVAQPDGSIPTDQVMAAVIEIIQAAKGK